MVLHGMGGLNKIPDVEIQMFGIYASPHHVQLLTGGSVTLGCKILSSHQHTVRNWTTNCSQCYTSKYIEKYELKTHYVKLFVSSYLESST